MEATRVDKWLWSVRVYSTRSQATAACNAAHVQVNGRPAKPSALVRVEDSVFAFAREVHRELAVRRIIEKRVGASVAVECYEDHTPEQAVAAPKLKLGLRDSGAGRPTKKDRRQIDKLRRETR